MLINFSSKAQEQNKEIQRLVEILESNQDKQTKLLDKIEKNLDFIKDQGTEINKLKNKLPSTEISQIREINTEVKEIRQLVTEIKEISLS